MTGPQYDPVFNPNTGGGEDPGSLGEIISDISAGLSRLFRQEVDLAKSELKAEATKDGKAAGMFSGAGVAGLLTLIMLSPYPATNPAHQRG